MTLCLFTRVVDATISLPVLWLSCCVELTSPCCLPFSFSYLVLNLPSVLWRCWLGRRKGIWPVKNWVVGCWRGYLSGARCRLAYGPADATATHCLLLGFTFLVPAHPGSPGKRAVQRVVCVCVSSPELCLDFSVYGLSVRQVNCSES